MWIFFFFYCIVLQCQALREKRLNAWYAMLIKSFWWLSFGCFDGFGIMVLLLIKLCVVNGNDFNRLYWNAYDIIVFRFKVFIMCTYIKKKKCEMPLFERDPNFYEWLKNWNLLHGYNMQQSVLFVINTHWLRYDIAPKICDEEL